jgi:hypothetical protein
MNRSIIKTDERKSRQINFHIKIQQTGELMAKKEETKEQNGTQTPAATGGDERIERTVRWDDANMKSSYANVCNVSSTREEVTLLFGTNQTWHTGQQELAILLSNRIILSPFAAKRLSLLLNNIIGQYESRFGKLHTE